MGLLYVQTAAGLKRRDVLSGKTAEQQHNYFLTYALIISLILIDLEVNKF